MIASRIVLHAAAGILLLFGFMSCKDEIAGENVNDIVFPAANVSYGKHVEPLFFRGCAFPGCHARDSQAGGLVLETYQEALSSRIGVIIPLDTLNSRIVWRIEGRPGVARMPLLRQPLNDNQIRGIKQWIMEGAQNN